MPRFNVRDNITVIAIFLNTIDEDFGSRNNTQTPVQFSYSSSSSSSQLPSSSSSSSSSCSSGGGDVASQTAPAENVFRMNS